VSRRRWVYTDGGRPLEAPVEVTQDWQQPDSGPLHRSEEEVYGHATATDGTDLSTRRRHSEYLKRNNLAMDSDFTNHWAKAEKQRERAATGDFDRRARREAIGRAAYEVEKGRRK
jgi:hypothetical protein